MPTKYKVDPSIKPFMRAIRVIHAAHPKEHEAAPSLRRFAIKHSIRRHLVFDAYREIVNVKEAEKTKLNH